MASKQQPVVHSAKMPNQPVENESNFSSYLSPIDKYRLEWTDLSTICEDSSLAHLRQIACAGHLRVAKFRSICWSVLLDVLRGDQHDWLLQRRIHRNMYAHIKGKWHTNPHQTSAPQQNDDPLSQSQQSVWNQHFCDQELYAVIRQDVVRTFPGVDFFRRDALQALMVDVLFCYAREHPHMCYRQGMHEILAPVLFVMHCDQQTLLHICDVAQSAEQDTRRQSVLERGDVDVDAVLHEILDPQYMEEDAYFIFMKIMVSIESFYHIRDMKPTLSGHFPSAAPLTAALTATGSPPYAISKLEVVGQLNHIRDKILAHVDPQLHKHLLELDIPLTLFGIRWLRLLFGREFSLLDLLVLWDAIFAEGKLFALTNYVVVAMLVQIRHQLLHGDYTTCLMHLMKYPGNVDIALVIRYAMHIKSPQLHDCPVGAFPPHNNRQPVAASATKPRQPNPIAQPLSPKPSGRPETSSATGTTHKRSFSHEVTTGSRTGSSNSSGSRPTSANKSASTADEHIKAHLRSIQNTTALAAMRMTAHTQAMQSGEQLTGVVEGFRENSREALRIELEGARAVMSITRFKLTQYLAVLRTHIPPGKTAASDNVHQAMDGIEELCSLLQIKPAAGDFGHHQSLPVECAFEAAAMSTYRPTAELPVSPPPLAAPANRPTFRQARAADFEIVVHPDSGGIVDTLAYATTSDDLAQLQPQQQRRRSSDTIPRYEIPDDSRRISRKASKILGDRKEVEMHEFRATVGGRLPSAGSTTLDDSTDETAHVSLLSASPSAPVVDPAGERDSPVH